MMIEDKRRDINKVKTSLTVKLGTRNRLMDIARKGESFDDVINRLISTNEINYRRVAEFESILKENDLIADNRIEITEISRGIGSISLGQNEAIRFSYNKPDEIVDNNYQMDVIIEDLIPRRDMLDEYLSDIQRKKEVYFTILERIINLHFDRSFSLPMNKNLLDPYFWKKVWKRIGLSDHSLDHDVIKFIEGIMEER